jgi:hypothetical protein
MAAPAIIWRNPNVVQRQRLWNEARHNAKCRVYIVVQSSLGEQNDWEGLPHLEMIEGGRAARTNKGQSRSTQSRA